ncbi:DNA helicase PIF1, ATP-dependent [Tanacetum coccineum]
MSKSLSVSRNEPKLMLNQLELGATGSIVVMICRMWDVNSSTGHGLTKEYCRFDGDTSVRKSSVKSEGFNRYPFQFVKINDLEPTNNKYLIDATGYVTNVGRTTQQKTRSSTLDLHLANHRLYLSSTSSSLIIDDEKIPTLRRLKTDDSSGLEWTKEVLPGDNTLPKPRTLENLLMRARNQKYDDKEWLEFPIPWLEFPIMWGDKCKKGNIGHKAGQFWCDSCDSPIEYPVLRLELEIYDGTTEAVVVMFDETTTSLFKCFDTQWWPLKRIEELEDSDTKGSFVADSQPKEDDVGCSSDTRKKRRVVLEDSDQSANLPSLSNILHTSVTIHSNTFVRRDGHIQSFCGLKLSDIRTPNTGTSSAPAKGSAHAKRKAIADTPDHPFPQTAPRTTGKKARKLAALSSSVAMQPCGMRKEITKETGLQIQPSHSVDKKVRIDHSINVGRGIYTFRINRQNYHRIGSLLPQEGTQPRYAQLWFFDTHIELRNRLNVFVDNETGDGVDGTIVGSLIEMLDQNSSITQAFRMARDWCYSHTSTNVELRLLSERTNSRQYNAPIVAEVAVLITNDFGDGEPTRDIIVNTKDGRPKRILELHPSYMALQYPLLFPYGEDRYHDKILYHRNTGIRKTNRDYVTMKEYYVYLNTAYPLPLDTAYPVLCPIQRIHPNRLIRRIHFCWIRFDMNISNYTPTETKGKTFITKLSISRLRSERKIVLVVASSGIVSLLLPAEYPLSGRAMQEVELIIWDEAPMTQKYAFKALDNTLRDILGYPTPANRNKIFSGLTVLLGGDFRQILPVIPKGKRSDIVHACISRSKLWKHCKVLAVDDGKLPSKMKDGEDEPTWIQIPKKFLINALNSLIAQIVAKTNPNFIERHKEDAYLRERAILTPRNDDANAINAYMFDKLEGESITYNSADEICKASTDTLDQQHLYLIES